MWAFQEKLEKLGHFYTGYDNIEDLKLQFRDQLDKLLLPTSGEALSSTTSPPLVESRPFRDFPAHEIPTRLTTDNVHFTLTGQAYSVLAEPMSSYFGCTSNSRRQPYWKGQVRPWAWLPPTCP